MVTEYEIVWHGRGGQGAVTAAKILTEAAFYEGFKGVSAKPTYFSERRGAPVSVHTRISRNPVRSFSNVLNPDIAVILDDNLLGMVNVTADIKDGGLLIINSSATPQELGLDGNFTIAIADAFRSSESAGLVVQGNVLVSTSILGPFIAASNLVSVETIRRALLNKFSAKSVEQNMKAIQLACEGTRIYRPVQRSMAVGSG
ncbi:MAG: pyruvate ferredoxin oxidoreductase gamma subunit [Thermodesulfobacteriota bacterium]|nr:pyruvate ferredoxin oxidoreductase gamma subunit [Thermodesulfobacteriota bacterium]